MLSLNKYGSLTIGMILIVLVGCQGNSQPQLHSPETPISFVQRLHIGDRNLNWALTYFDSWNRKFQFRYLKLAEKKLVHAIQKFSSLQSDTSPRIREFYIVQDRRARSCRLLSQFHMTASHHGHLLNGDISNYCIF